MFKLFDHSRPKLSIEEISNEMIQNQINDDVVSLYVVEFTKIIDYLKRNGGIFFNNAQAMKDKDYRRLLENLEEITYKRFGFNAKIVDGGDDHAAVVSIPPKEYNALSNRSNDKLYKEIKREARNKYSEYDYETTELLHIMSDTITSLEKALNAKGVTIDLKNAKIKGLPKTYRIIFFFNFDTLVNSCGIDDPKELTAIFLHEVGHGFTHLESSYRQISNVSVLVNTFIANIANKNKTPKESFILAYQKMSGDKSASELKNKNKLTVAVVTGKRALDFIYLTNNPHAFSDSEQHADQFAGKFGLGEYLVTGLDKVHRNFKTEAGVYGFLSLFLFFAMAFIFILSIGTMLVINTMMYGFLALSFGTAAYNIIFSKNNTSAENTYDDLKQRYKRIRNELVRTLRSVSLSNDDVESTLNSIDTIDRIMSKTSVEWEGPLNKIHRILFTRGQLNYEIQQIEEITEDLMENELHVASKRLKTV